MINFNFNPTNKREEFVKSLNNLTDNELLQKIVESQHLQMELINRNRRNTSTIVWVIAISILISIAFSILSLIPLVL